jgi:hypothetical protein
VIPVTTGDDLSRPVGAWRALGDLRLRALWPEGILGAVIGGGGAAFAIGHSVVTQRVDLMGDLTALAGALIAVVFTALVLVVSIPSDSYLRTLAETPGGGIRNFLDPFLLAVGTQIMLVLLTIGYKLAAADAALWLEHGAFVLAGALFVFGLLDIASLARQLVRHGILRAADVATAGDDREDGSVSHLSHRRG